MLQLKCVMNGQKNFIQRENNMKIKVTEQDIKEGTICSPWHCPVAKALFRNLKEEVTVLGPKFRIRYDKTILLPIKVKEFIHSFDNGEKVEPFEFEVKV